jgi:uncharacterized membrane protein YkoI
MIRMSSAAAVVLAAALATNVALAGAHTHAKTSLASQAKIGKAAARATALAKVPGGKIRSSELERENGKLIYSFDIEVPSKPGIEEVQISAITGKVVTMKHETPQQERAEAREESAKKK